ncbi:beta carbonic anhydrase 5, chloroplastic isoform X2 [Tanacetum coccineum]
MTLLGFVNFKLYESINLKYPPILDPRLKALAVGSVRETWCIKLLKAFDVVPDLEIDDRDVQEALEEISREKQYQEKCLSMLGIVIESSSGGDSNDHLYTLVDSMADGGKTAVNSEETMASKDHFLSGLAIEEKIELRDDDSRVCPSYILGFQPGEAFVVRNIANLVLPFENGPCETNAALEFSVNALQVENILVTGHSCCGGIRALMSMDDEDNSSFIKNWVVELINNSLLNLLSAFVSEDDEEMRACKSLFQNKTFFLGHDVGSIPSYTVILKLIPYHTNKPYQ